MTKPVLIVLHQEHSTPGRVGYSLRMRGYRLDIRRPPLGDDLPTDLSLYAGCVIFGGPMSANDEAPWIDQELALIERVVKADCPYLGLCLGAQLYSRASGARVWTHPEAETEIGYYPVSPTRDGEDWARAHSIDWPSHVYHWHREGFDLPRGATLLATGDTFPNQAFRVGKSVFGLQFHPEVTYAMICRWTVRAFDRMQTKGARPADTHREGWFSHDRAVAMWLDGLLDALLAPSAV